MTRAGPDPATVLTSHAAAVRRLAGAIVFDPFLADDVAQDSLRVAWERPARARGAPWSWFAGVVRNVARNALRGERRRRAREAAAAPRPSITTADAPLDHLVRLETQRRVLETLLRLREPLRQTLVLHYLEGLSIDAVAARMQAPRETVRTRVRTGLTHLRSMLLSGGGEERGKLRGALVALAGGLPSEAAALVLGGIAVHKTIVALAVAALLILGAGVWFLLAPAERRAADSSTQSVMLGDGPRLLGRANPAHVAPAPPVATRRFTGRVLATGTLQPLADARVRAFPADVAAFLSSPESPGTRSLGSTLTGADGRFELIAEGDSPVLVLLAEAPERSPGWQFARAGTEVVLALPPWRLIEGRVHDIDSQPIVGALVRWQGVLGSLRVEREARSARDGSYRLTVPWQPAFLPALTAMFEATADGFAATRVPFARVASEAGDTHLDVLLLRGATLRGRVVEAGTDEPLAGARVLVWSVAEVGGVERFDGGTLSNPWYARTVGDVRTGPDGAFRIEHLPAWSGWPVGMHIGSLLERRLGFAAALAEGHVLERRELRVPEDGQDVVFQFSLAPAGTIEGEVMDEQRRPVPGAYVGWRWTDDSSAPWLDAGIGDDIVLHARTDDLGHYQLGGVPASRDGSVRVRIEATPPSSPVRWLARVDTEVAVATGRASHVPTLVLARGPRVRTVDLLVLDPGGAPVAGAHAQGGVAGGSSGPDGRLTVYFEDGFPPSEASARLTVAAVGREPRTVEAVPSLEAPPQVRVVLTPATSLPLSTAATLPEPAPSLTLRLEDAATGRPILKHAAVLRGQDGQERQYSNSNLVAGTCVFVEVPPGAWTLRVEAPGYETVERDVQIGRPESPREMSLRLVRSSQLTVYCRSATGAPLRDGRLTLLGGGYWNADTDAEGRAVLRGVKPGVRHEATLVETSGRGPARWFVPVPFQAVEIPAAGPGEMTLSFALAGVATVRVSSPRLGPPDGPLTESQREARRGTRLALVDVSGQAIWQRVGLVGSGWSLLAPQGRSTLRLEVPGAPALEREVTLTNDPSTVIALEVPE